MEDLIEQLDAVEDLEDLYYNFRQERRLRDRCNPFEVYSDGEFKQRYRLRKGTVHNLLLLIGDNITTPRDDRRGNPLNAASQLFLALRFYATGSFNKVIGDVDGVHEASVCRAVSNVNTAICMLKQESIKFPIAAELHSVKADFSQLSRDNFPGIIGAIDCTHIRISCPNRANAQVYINRKGYYSVNVQAISDAKLKFTNIVARWPGSTHDSRIFRCSRIKEVLETGRISGHLLGDCGYACQHFLLTPVRNPRTPGEERYNIAHRRARNVVERTFGVWKKRFPCLSLGLRTNIRKSLQIIVATAIMHNLAMVEGEGIDEAETIEEVPIVNAADNDFNGNRWRQQIITRHFT